MEYTPQPIADTTFEFAEYTPASITNTTFELGGGVVQILSPVDLATGQSKTPTFSWEAYKPESGRRYQVLVSTSENDFSNALQYITPNTSFTIPTKDQLSGSTTYYWKVRPAVAVLLSGYSEDFTTADQSEWVSPWVTETLSGIATQTIASNKATLGIDANGISVARLEGITADNFDQYYRSQSFSTVGAGSEITYHFRTQGDWRADNFITGYFSWVREDKISIGVIPEGQSPYLLGTVTFVRDDAKLYDIRTRGDASRFRLYIFENGTTEPTEPTIEVVDENETFISGGFAVKLAGSVASDIAIDSISATFGEATAGLTVTSFAIDQSDTTVSANGTRQLTTTTQGTNVSGGATWASSNEAVATVDSNGLVTWVSAGTVTITATSTDDNAFTDTVQITAQAIGDYVAQDSRAGDEAFMQAFYDSTNGGSWENNIGWVDGDMDLSRADIAGVTVDTVGGELRIVNFDMAKEITDGTENFAVGGNNIIGELPPEWGNLKKCVNFNIKQNFFTGEIPDTVQPGSLLERISLGGQKGELELTKRSEWFEVRHRGRLYGESIGGGTGKRREHTNDFTGPLPTSFRHCTNGKLIEIRGQRCSGTLPAEWGDIGSSLEAIFLCDNQLEGSLPTEWGAFTQIKWMHLYNGGADLDRPTGEFTGQVPQSWQDNWANLANIRLHGNAIDGDFPDFPNSKDKRYYSLEQNQFDGDFPSSIFDGNNRFMSMVSLRENLVYNIPQTIPFPTFPESASSYNYISTMRLDNCGLTGDIPLWVQEISSFIQFQLNGNSFTGPFPIVAAENPKMRLFWIGGNELSGDLPDVSWGTEQLYSVLINSNNFTGNIPASWSTMKDSQRGVWRFYANNNELEGAIPTWLSEMPDLERLRIQNNRFTYKDILPLYQTILSNLNAAGQVGRGSVDDYIINPQKAFNVPNESVSGAAPVSVDLSSIDYTNNAYQWQRLDGSSWVSVSGQTTHTLSTSTSGDYRLRITNPDLPELEESISKTINVTIT